jgi:integrase
VHLAENPVTTRDALLFPGRDGSLLAHSSLYGLPAREERRDGRVYRKEPFGFMRARLKIGKPGLHWHDLRRTAATLGAQAGATVREMQSRLGHSTPQMALHYQSATAERDRTIADRLQAQIDGAQ